MKVDDRPAGNRVHGGSGRAQPRSQLFAVRLWKEAVDGGWEYRGSVREVISGARAGFRDWPGLVSFLMAQLDEAGGSPAQPKQGGT